MLGRCIIVVLAIIAQVCSHGSHQHMKNAKNEHTHYVPTQPGDSKSGVQSILRDTQLLHDSEHIREDLSEVISEQDIAKMSNDELEFHYFKLHDYDNNNKLDGTEMLAAIIHIMPVDPELEQKPAEGQQPDPALEKRYKDAMRRRNEAIGYYSRMIDKMLEDNDKDGDGYINYAEYVISRKVH